MTVHDPKAFPAGYLAGFHVILASEIPGPAGKDQYIMGSTIPPALLASSFISLGDPGQDQKTSFLHIWTVG
jgi:hypothetical protein